ncbi:MAG: peptide deformylase, peptide deformylase [Candidatus Levybacteria bacterium]|nr:peptide deformylase, peptide deformylase [Candidatus Levybacteria bacterium]
MIKIVTAPNPALSNIAKPVLRIDVSVVKIVEEMKKTLAATTDPKGVGLAAPQIGKSLRIFIAKPTDESKILVFINPEIIERSSKVDYVKRPKKAGKKSSKKLEGCLSLPNIWGPVLRASSLTLSYLDEQGKHHEQKFADFLATIVQHEMDHLDGVLFPKRVLEQKGILYKSSKNAKGEDEFEKIEI